MKVRIFKQTNYIHRTRNTIDQKRSLILRFQLTQFHTAHIKYKIVMNII